MSLETKLLQVLADSLDRIVQLDDVVLNASAIDGRDIVMTIEDELKVDIPDEDAENLYTVKDILNYLTTKYPEKDQPEEQK